MKHSKILLILFCTTIVLTANGCLSKFKKPDPEPEIIIPKPRGSHPSALQFYLAQCALENSAPDGTPNPLVEEANKLIELATRPRTYQSETFKSKKPLEISALPAFFKLSKHMQLTKPLEALEAYQQLCQLAAPTTQARVFAKWYKQLFDLFESKKDYKRCCALAHAAATQPSNKKDKDAACKDLKKLLKQYPSAIYFLASTKLQPADEQTLLQRSPLQQIPFWVQFFRHIKSASHEAPCIKELKIDAKIEQLAKHPNNNISMPCRALMLALRTEQAHLLSPAKNEADLRAYKQTMDTLLRSSHLAINKATEIPAALTARSSFALVAAITGNDELLVSQAEDCMRNIQGNGFIIPPDQSLAFSLFSLYPDNPLAQIRLATMYLQEQKGINLQDIPKAIELAEKAYKTFKKHLTTETNPSSQQFFQLSHAAALCGRFYSNSKTAHRKRALKSAVYTSTHIPTNVRSRTEHWSDACCFMFLAAFSVQGVCEKSQFKPSKDHIDFIQAANYSIMYLAFAPVEEILLSHQNPDSTLAIIVKELTKLAQDKNSKLCDEAQKKLDNLKLGFKNLQLQFRLLPTTAATLEFSDLKGNVLPAQDTDGTSSYIIHGAYHEQTSGSAPATSCSTDPDH